MTPTMPIQGVPRRPSLCERCGKPFLPYPRSARAQRFCSDSCRRVAWEQARLDFATPLVPLVTPKQIREAHKPATRRVLEMLQAGPVQTREFLAAGIGRFGARIAELRAVGWQIETRKTSERAAVYTLAGERFSLDIGQMKGA